MTPTLDCPGPCQASVQAGQLACGRCVRLLPLDLVALASQSQDMPDLYATVVSCAASWFRVRYPQARALPTTQVHQPASMSA
jgi:hypothetical protein